MFAKIAEVVATNLAKGPGERASHVFGGRYDGVPTACDVLSRSLFATITGEKDSGLAKFEPSSLDERNPEYPGGLRLNAIEQKCTRKTAEQLTSAGDQGKSLIVALSTYRGVEQAEFALRFDCDPETPSGALLGKPVMVDDPVGDSPACVRPIDTPVYYFRTGRTVVEVHANRAWSGTSLTAFASDFAPHAKKVADKVREFS